MRTNAALIFGLTAIIAFNTMNSILARGPAGQGQGPAGRGHSPNGGLNRSPGSMSRNMAQPKQFSAGTARDGTARPTHAMQSSPHLTSNSPTQQHSRFAANEPGRSSLTSKASPRSPIGSHPMSARREQVEESHPKLAEAHPNHTPEIRNNTQQRRNDHFTPPWWDRHPHAVYAGWGYFSPYAYTSWGTLAGWLGYPVNTTYSGTGESVSYDYGNNVLGYTEPVAEAKGAGDAVSASETKWLSLGTFALKRETNADSTLYIQLVVDKEGTIAGTFYDSTKDTTELISGTVDRKSRRATWTVGKLEKPVLEADIQNLTKNATSITVRFDLDVTQTWQLVRLDSPDPK